MAFMFDTLDWAPIDTMELEAFNAWTDRIRAQLVPQPPFIPPSLPYQSFMPSPTNLGAAFNNSIPVSGPIAVSSPASVPTPALTEMTESAQENDTTSIDDDDISSAENDNEDLTSSEDRLDDTSSAADDDLSSAKDYGDDFSPLEGDDVVHPTSPTHNDKPTSDGITSVRPHNLRPNISLELVRDSTVASKLPSFLTQMRAANQELEEEKCAGTLADRRIEIDGSSSAVEGEEHIEMNLSLGVLEEKSYETDTTNESDSSHDEGGSNIMEKLLIGKRKRGLGDDKEGVPKKVKIQEV